MSISGFLLYPLSDTETELLENLDPLVMARLDY